MERIKLLRYINVATLLVVGAFNLMDCIVNQRGAERYIAFVAPFVLIAIIMMIWRSYKINAVLYAIGGLAIAFTGNTGNFSGAIFLIFSIYIFNTPLTNYLLIGACAVSIVGRYIFMGYTIPDTMNQFVAYAFTFGIYFILMHPKQKPKPIISKVDDTTRDIVKYLKDGLRVKEIAPLVYLSTDSVYHRLKRAREKYECGNNVELYEKFDEQGFFMQKNDGMN